MVNNSKYDFNLSDNEFIECHQGLVHSVIHRFGSRLADIENRTNLGKEDLTQHGFIGLLKARRNFDPERGFQFSTFAYPTIYGEIQRAIRDGGKVKVPRTIRDANYLINSQKLMNLPPEEISEKLGVSLKVVKEALKYETTYLSLNTKVYDNGEDSSLEVGDILPLDYSVEESILSNDFIKRFTDTLGERDKYLWYMTHAEGLTQRELGDKLGISQVHVSRLLKKVGLKALAYGKNQGYLGNDT